MMRLGGGEIYARRSILVFSPPMDDNSRHGPLLARVFARWVAVRAGVSSVCHSSFDLSWHHDADGPVLAIDIGSPEFAVVCCRLDYSTYVEHLRWISVATRSLCYLLTGARRGGGCRGYRAPLIT